MNTFSGASITIEPLKLSPYPAGRRGRHPSNELSDVEREIRNVVAEFEERMDRAPSILDWDSGLNLHSMLPNLPVCSPIPSPDANRLPYLDSTIDIVAIPASALGRMEEARRVVRLRLSSGVWRLSGNPNQPLPPCRKRRSSSRSTTTFDIPSSV